jgi:hypothetical protein
MQEAVLMRTSTRRGAIVGAITLVVGFGAAVPAATATSPPAPPVTGILALDTGATNTVTLLDAQGKPTGTTQSITQDKACELSTSGDLLAFEPVPDTFQPVGLKDGKIGVRDSGTATGTSCSSVDSSSGESLIIAIGPKAARGGHSLIATSASLDVALKQGAKVSATMELAGTPTGTAVLECGVTADCGPDSGVNDHVRWPIGSSTDGVVFDTLVLEALVGSFSLSGGADGVVSPETGIENHAGASIFELVDAVDCNESVTFTPGENVQSSKWKRLDNLGTDCTAYTYTTATGTDAAGPYAHFGVAADADPDAQALWEVTFVYSGKTPTALFAFDETNGIIAPVEAFTALGACNPADVTTSGARDGWVPTPDYAYGNLDVENNTVVGFACLLDTRTANVKGVKTVTFTAYVLGDAGMRY